MASIDGMRGAEALISERRERTGEQPLSREMVVYQDVQEKKEQSETQKPDRLTKPLAILTGLSAVLSAAAIGAVALAKFYGGNSQHCSLQCSFSGSGMSNPFGQVGRRETDSSSRRVFSAQEEGKNRVCKMEAEFRDDLSDLRERWGALSPEERAQGVRQIDEIASNITSTFVSCRGAMRLAPASAQKVMADFLKELFLPRNFTSALNALRIGNLRQEITNSAFIETCKTFSILAEQRNNWNMLVCEGEDACDFKPMDFTPWRDRVTTTLSPFTRGSAHTPFENMAHEAALYRVGPPNFSALRDASTMDQIVGMQRLLQDVTHAYAQHANPLPPWYNLMWGAREALAWLRTTQATGISMFDIYAQNPSPTVQYVENTAALFTQLYNWPYSSTSSLSFRQLWDNFTNYQYNSRVYGNNHYTEETVREVGFLLLNVARELNGTTTIIYSGNRDEAVPYNLTEEIDVLVRALS